MKVYLPQAISVYPPNTYWPFLMMVTVCFLRSQLVWKVFTTQPCLEARWHSSHREGFPTAGARKCERLPRKPPMFDKIVELMEIPVKYSNDVTP